MCYANNEKGEKRNNRRNRATKSGKHQNTLRKRKLQVPENIGSEYHQTNRDEGKSM